MSWIKLHRQLAKNDLWLAEPFTRGQAWVDLLMLATHKDCIIIRRGITVKLQRGDIGMGERELSKRWGWSRNKLRRFIDTLVDQKMAQKISRGKTSVSHCIHITKYKHYQSVELLGDTEDDTENGTEDDTEDGTISRMKKKVQEDIVAPRPTEAPCPQTKIIDLFQQVCIDLDPVTEWTDTRKAWLRSRWREKKERQSLEWWQEFFERVHQSDFLCGRVKAFRATLAWLVKAENMAKVLDGFYDNRKPGDTVRREKIVCSECSVYQVSNARCKKDNPKTCPYFNKVKR